MNARPEFPTITPDFVPATEAEMEACLASWEWRIYSGQLYKILSKSTNTTGDEVTQILNFIPNVAQTDFLNALHYRNVILKARQLGFTTCIAIVWLDHALFNANQRCAIIAQTREAAEEIFADKVKFAYENLPDALRDALPLKRQSASVLQFSHNNSSIRVVTKARSGTFQRLHVSEMGKIAATKPKDATEIVTGSLPTVPIDGIAVIESTAEGQSGEFFKIASTAQKLKEAGKELTVKEFRFHFYPWHHNPDYAMDPRGVIISPEEHEYFDRVEVEMDVMLTLRQRAWYVSQRDTEFSGDAEKMWREYPSTPGECWQKSTEGTYYAAQLARARSEGRIVEKLPVVSNVLVHTFWDIGANDGTGIWFMQHVGGQERFIRYIEGWGESYDYYVKQMRDMGFIFGSHFLPHDAEHKRQLGRVVAAPRDMLRELAPDWRFEIVPRVDTIQHGIDLTRLAFSRAWFCETGCKLGLGHLAQYSKRWNTTQQNWADEPLHDVHSEAADSLRQWAQGYDPRIATPRPKGATRGGNRRRRGVM